MIHIVSLGKKCVIRDLLRELRETLVLTYLDRDAAIDRSRPFGLNYDDACLNVCRTTLEGRQSEGTIRPTTFLSRVATPNGESELFPSSKQARQYRRSNAEGHTFSVSLL